MSLLDDLMEAGDAAPAAAPARPRARWSRLAGLAGFTALWTVLGYGLLTAAGLAVPTPVLAAVSLTLVCLRRMVRAVRPQRGHGRSDPDPDAGAESTDDGRLIAVRRWDTLLDWCQSDPGRFNRRLQPRLADVVDGWLRRRHGLTLTSDPERARALLGEQVWLLLTEPARRAPSARDLDRLVNVVEDL